MKNTYLIRGGLQGRERLRILSQVMQSSGVALLRRAGVGAGASCLDVGCGGGDLACDFARLVGAEGRVVGVDIDETKLSLAQSEALSLGFRNIEFRHLDITKAVVGEKFDFVHARFLLTHLPDPAAALARMAAALKPGGVLVLQDIDMEGQFSWPASPAMDRYKDLYTRVARCRGGDPFIGRRLPALLAAAGLNSIAFNVVQPAATSGDVKLIAPITMENIAASLIDEGLASATEVEQIIAELYASAHDPNMLMSVPRIVEAWAQA